MAPQYIARVLSGGHWRPLALAGVRMRIFPENSALGDTCGFASDGFRNPLGIHTVELQAEAHPRWIAIVRMAGLLSETCRGRIHSDRPILNQDRAEIRHHLLGNNDCVLRLCAAPGPSLASFPNSIRCSSSGAELFLVRKLLRSTPMIVPIIGLTRHRPLSVASLIAT